MGISYTEMMTEIQKLTDSSLPSIHARAKIRVVNNTFHAGAMVPKADDVFKTSGSDYIQIAASSSSSENSFGQYPDSSDTSYAAAGGTYGIPFRVSLVHQARNNSKQEVDWKIAFDYTMLMDKYVHGFERVYDDGSTRMIYVHPQYWYSKNLTLYRSGPLPLSKGNVNHCE